MATPATDPRRLYRDIVEIEKQLRELLRSNPLNAQDANALRSRLTDKAQQLAQAAPAFAAQRELEQVLWKPCFYKRIEDFRRRIRKYASAPTTDRSVREHFAKVSHEFQEFLRDAAGFYDRLREAYTAYLLKPPRAAITRIASHSDVASDPPVDQDVDRCRTSLHRCLVFLGDLARYRELHSQKAKKNFAAAENFYYKALAVIPENGNPHNQLAVLATYVEAETVAVYRYCRSLLIAQPFVTAEENLALLFERSRQRPLAPPTAPVAPTASAKDKAAALKSVLHRLTRLHGLLFSLATKPAGNNASSSSSSSTTTAAPLVYSKEMESLVVKDLRLLLPTGAVGDALLIKLVVTNIFCIEKAMASSGSSSLDDALRLAVRVVTAVLEFVLAELAKAQLASSSEPTTTLRLLGAVSTFTDYLRYNERVLGHVDELLGREDDQGSVKLLLETLATLLNHSTIQAGVQAITASSGSVKAKQLQLKENVELRGFQPLSSLVDAGAATRWRDDLSTTTVSATTASSAKTELSDADAWRVRAWNLSAFARFLCDDYRGNPLLYLYKGAFSTSPSVVAGVFASSANGNTTPSYPTSSSADDFDDEIIVYQPSPSLTPSQPRRQGSSALGGSANSVLAPFSLGGFGTSLAPPPPQVPMAQPAARLSLSPSTNDALLFGSLGSSNSNSSDSGAAISASLAYPGFASFGSGAFGGTFLGSPWQSNPAQSNLPPRSLSRSFLSDDAPNSKTAGLLSAMDDLAAIERESALYQQKESTLSAFLNRQPPSPAAPAWSGATPATMRSLSVGGSRPPPGLGAPPGFGSSSSSPASDGEPRPQLFTRNPFANP